MTDLAGLTPRTAVKALLAPQGRRDPYPLYEVIRAAGDVVAIKPGLMVAVGYDACDQALRESRLRVQDGESYDLIYPDWRAHSCIRGYVNSMLYHNAPGHDRMRRLVSGAFTRRRVLELARAIETMADRLLDQVADLGADGSPVDFIAEFASRLPIAVISALLGVPEHDQAWFRAVAADVTIALEGITSQTRLDPADSAMDELSEYFTELVERRWRAPVGDMVSDLAQICHGDGERLSQDELLGNMMLMLTAGFETTSFLLGHALLLAFSYPENRARLCDEPGFAIGYVEEVLRFEPPVQATSRWAATEVTLQAAIVPADTKLVVMMGAGNRDPRRFAQPGRFDPGRPDIRPLSFGSGGHFCLGAPLSRLEAQIALPRLLRRFPRLAAAQPPVRRDTWVGRGLDYFAVSLR
jgi:cytochrome P450